MAKMNWRNAQLAGKATGDAQDGGLRKESTTKAQKRRARQREKKKLYGFYKDHKPEPVRHIHVEDYEPPKVGAK